MSAEEQARWINENSDYAYIGAGLAADSPNTAETIIAYEYPRGREMALLFADGHVEWHDVPDAMDQLQKQAADRGIELPERR
jgi:prepilin-type processing-associated H-X9-DG protein